MTGGTGRLGGPAKTRLPEAFSKSRLMSWRQCERRLWLELHRPDLADLSGAAAAFRRGNEVGAIARRIYDPAGRGILIDLEGLGVAGAIARTGEVLAERRPIFEAGFQARLGPRTGARAFADILLPRGRGRTRRWHMVEVKAASKVHDHYHDDAAIQFWTARAAGLKLETIGLAHVDTAWTYPGGEDYAGLLKEVDLTAQVAAREGEVRAWLKGAGRTARLSAEPVRATGPHCRQPYPCGFIEWCGRDAVAAKYPVEWLPGVGPQTLDAWGVRDMRKVSDNLLDDRQRRVKQATIGGKAWFDRAGAGQALAALSAQRPPIAFLDFETVQFAVPVWKGTRPYQQIPFQFSLHRLSRTGKLEHRSFLDLTGKDPRAAFARALVEACGTRGPICAWWVSFERGRLQELARDLPAMAGPLHAIAERLVDLQPVAKDHFYAPGQQGSWSLKAVLPALAPELDHAALAGVQDGAMAMEAYFEATDPGTAPARRRELRDQLTDYCTLDTLGLVRIWRHFAGWKGRL